MLKLPLSLALSFLLLTPALAEKCGHTECPHRYKNLICYDAGTATKGAWSFPAKVCVVDQKGGVMSIQGDLILTIERSPPTAILSTFSMNVPVIGCSVIFYGANRLQAFNTGGVFFQLQTGSKDSDSYIITPQMTDDDVAAFKRPQNIRATRCDFGDIDVTRK